MTLQPLHGVVIGTLDRTGLVFSESHQRIYGLDEFATAVWLCLWSERSGYEAAARLLVSSGQSQDQAASFVAECLIRWRAAGLIGPPETESAAPTLSSACGAAQPLPFLHGSDVFDIVGIRIAVSYPDSTIAVAVREVAGHLCTSQETTAHFQFVVRACSPGYRVNGMSDEQHSLPNAAALAVWLKNGFLDVALGRDPDCMGLHSAALLAPTGAVLLAGASGRGKTTLAAVLNARGWPLIADDVVLVTAGSPHVRGLPLSFAAKRPSWGVLRNDLPGLERLRPRQRPDGRLVKYIAPRTVSNPNEGSPVAVIAFPHFRSDAGLNVRAFDKPAALQQLLEEARNARHYLSAPAFLTLCSILRAATVITLEYDDSSRAADCLAALTCRDRTHSLSETDHLAIA